MRNTKPYKPAVVHSAEKRLYSSLEEQALKMRNYPTLAEARLWKELSCKKLGVKFRRQHIINRFIVDFYCIEKVLVIEVDGDIHDYQQVRDDLREGVLESLGCTILRFRNEEILSNIENVIKKIKEACLLIPPLGGQGAKEDKV